MELLLREAFHTDVPAADYARLSSAGEWDDDPGPGRTWVNNLLEHLHELREYTPLRPYWAARRVAPAKQPVRTVTSASERFVDLVGRLHADGYLARDFAEPCVDDPRDEQSGRDLNTELQQRRGAPAHPSLWPLQPEAWDTDTFYGLVEVFHDLVARPRSRRRHEFNDCGLHFEDFDTDAGRRVYRALVNRLLTESAVELRLAETGEDEGRLVRVVDDARSALVAQTLAAPSSDGGDRVQHAIALFRRRGADAEDKRLAASALFGVLEERLASVKAAPQITSKDESDLFTIANNLALRHQDVKQKRSYDPIFLDWIFWWFLSTIEITNQVLARRISTCTTTS